MRTFVFKAYNHTKRNRKLHRQIDIASQIWNHCIALHKRYYRLFKKHLNIFQLMKHITRMKKMARYKHWNGLGSQAIQEIVQRIEKSYQAFFLNLKKKSGRKVRPPGFRKRIKYKSFTLKQAGYSVSGNKIVVGKQHYQFFKSREIEGAIKTLTIKRDTLGDIYFVFVTDAEHQVVPTASCNKAGGDMGLKDYLTISDGSRVKAPEPLKAALKELKAANRNLSSKKNGSNNRKKAKKNLARLHIKISNQRNDFHFKLARKLVKTYQLFCIEDLNMAGMKALWGRKVSDLGFADFVKILEFQATKTTSKIVKIDRWFPSSKQCSSCKAINQGLTLRERVWTCTCGVTHDRDLNAAINILEEGLAAGVGASTLRVGNVRQVAIPAVAA